VAGDPARLARQITTLIEGGSAVGGERGDHRGSAQRLSNVLADAGLSARSWTSVEDPGRERVVAPIARASRARAQLAILAESDVTAEVAHRVARPRPADRRLLRRPRPGSYVVHRQHGVARYAGVTTG